MMTTLDCKEAKMMEVSSTAQKRSSKMKKRAKKMKKRVKKMSTKNLRKMTENVKELVVVMNVKSSRDSGNSERMRLEDAMGTQTGTKR